MTFPNRISNRVAPQWRATTQTTEAGKVNGGNVIHLSTIATLRRRRQIMKRHLSITLGLAFMAALSIIGLAIARAGQKPVNSVAASERLLMGTVIAIDDDKITVEKKGAMPNSQTYIITNATKKPRLQLKTGS